MSPSLGQENHRRDIVSYSVHFVRTHMMSVCLDIDGVNCDLINFLCMLNEINVCGSHTWKAISKLHEDLFYSETMLDDVL